MAESTEGLPDDLTILFRAFSAEIDGYITQLQQGDLTPEAWEKAMKKALATYINAAYRLGTGRDDLNQSAIERVKFELNRQLQYLRGFTEEIDMKYRVAENMGYTPKTWKDPKSGMPWVRWQRRAGMYANATVPTYWAGAVEGLPLPAVPGDSSTQCQSNCRCKWDIKTLDESNGDYDCYWILDPGAEHCQTCIQRDVDWKPLQVRQWQLVLPNYTITTTERKELLAEVMRAAFKGGAGSGNFAHAGRPGKRGGSQPRNGKDSSVFRNPSDLWPEVKVDTRQGVTSAKAKEFGGMLLHASTADHIGSIDKGGLVANVGDWVSEAYGEYTGEEYNNSEGESSVPAAVYFVGPENDDPTTESMRLLRIIVARKLGKGYDEVSMEDVRKHGLLVSVRPEDIEDADDLFRVGENGDRLQHLVVEETFGSDGEESEDIPEGVLPETKVPESAYVGTLFNLKPYTKARYQMKTDYSQSNEYIGPESGDYISLSDVTPSQLLFGNQLVLYIQRMGGDFGQSFKAQPGAHKRLGRLFIKPPKKALKGGLGSGNFQHAGRPGERGGSAPKGRKAVIERKIDAKILKMAGLSRSVRMPIHGHYSQCVLVSDGHYFHNSNEKYSSHTFIYAAMILADKEGKFEEVERQLARKVYKEKDVENSTLEDMVQQRLDAISIQGRPESGQIDFKGQHWADKTQTNKLIRRIVGEVKNNSISVAGKESAWIDIGGRMAYVPAAELELLAGVAESSDNPWEWIPRIKEIGLKERLEQALKGGSGSGNFGHAGRPGKRGGSQGQGHRADAPKIKGINPRKLKTVESIDDWHILRAVLNEDGTLSHLPVGEGKYGGNDNTHTLIYAAQVINKPEGFDEDIRQEAKEILATANYEDSKFETQVEEKTGGISVFFEQYDGGEWRKVNHLIVKCTADSAADLTQKIKRVKRMVDKGNLPSTHFNDITITAQVPPRHRDPATLAKFGIDPQEFANMRTYIDRHFSADEFDRFASLDDEYHARLKGGPGSGNFAHAGRPGRVGGSGPGKGWSAGKLSAEDVSRLGRIGYKEAESYDKAGIVDSDGYVEKPQTFAIFPDGRVIYGMDGTSLSGNARHTMLYAGYVITHPKEFEDKRYWNEEAKDWSTKTILEGSRQILDDFTSENEAHEKAVMEATGAMSAEIDFTSSRKYSILQFKSVEGMAFRPEFTTGLANNLVKKVRRLYQDGKLPQATYVRLLVPVTLALVPVNRLDDFKYVRKIEDGWYETEFKEASLKERLTQALKGGMGSGNYGHVGIPGHWGGSAPSKSGNIHGISEVAAPGYVRSEAMEAHRDAFRTRGYRETANYSDIPDDVEKVILRGNGKFAYMDDGLSFHTRIYGAIILQNKAEFGKTEGGKALIRKSRDILESIENEDAEVETIVSDWDDAYSLDIKWSKAIPGNVMIRYMGELGEREIAPEMTRMVRKLQGMVKRGDIDVIPASMVRGFDRHDAASFKVVAGGRTLLIPGNELEFIGSVTVNGNLVDVRLKGGKGSGNFAHAGRPGHKGGSQPQHEIAERYSHYITQDSDYAVDRAKLRKYWEGKGKVIKSDLSNLDSVWGRSQWLDEDGTLFGTFGNHTDSVRDLFWGLEIIDAPDRHGRMPGAIERMKKRGFARVEIDKRRMVIDAPEINPAQFRTLLKAHKWVNEDADFIADVHYKKFDDWDDFRKDFAQRYKERLKGGRGSGNFGHAGRPGHRGGSQPNKGGNVHGYEPEIEIMTAAEPSGNHIPGSGPAEVIPELAEKLYFANSFPMNQDPWLDWEDKRTARDVQGWIDGQKSVGVDIMPAVSRIYIHHSDYSFDDAYAVAKLESPEGKKALSEYGERGESGKELYEKVKKRIMLSAGDVLGFYNQENREIHFRPIKDGYISHGGNTFPADLVFAHECGHAMQYRRRKQTAWDVEYYAQPDFDRFTRYSQANSHEGFAESYLTYLSVKGSKVNWNTITPRILRPLQLIAEVVNG